MVFGFIKLCRKLAMSQVFYCTYFLPFLKKKICIYKIKSFFPSLFYILSSVSMPGFSSDGPEQENALG